MNNGEYLEVYYDLYDIFQDIPMIADAMIELGLTSSTRCMLIQNMEYTRLHNVASELDQLYDMPMKTLIAFKSRKEKKGKQTDICDFIDKEC